MKLTLLTLFIFTFLNHGYCQDLRKVTQENWVEYLIPDFINDVTDYNDNMSPHYMRFDYESTDKKIHITILVNNSDRYPFNLKSSFNAELNNKDYKAVTYKKLFSDRYYFSANDKNGRIIYSFCLSKNNYGYTYTIEYEKQYEKYFDAALSKIIKGFKILF